MAKIVLTVQLQQDNGTPVFTGTETKTSFTLADYDQVRSFLVSPALASLVRTMGLISNGVVSLVGTPTVNIHDLGN